MNIITIPVEWIRASRYAEATGEPMDAVESRIRSGEWAAGQEYKRTGPRTLWINIKAVTAWLNRQKHVESVSFPKASNSGKASASA